MRMTIEELRAYQAKHAPVKPNKYKNVQTVVDNITFSSKHEANRYQKLKVMQKAGLIADLELQPKYWLIVNDVKICRYIADFKYVDVEKTKLQDAVTGDFVVVVEDAKGVKTPVYRLKKKLMKAIYNIDVLEC